MIYLLLKHNNSHNKPDQRQGNVLLRKTASRNCLLPNYLNLTKERISQSKEQGSRHLVSIRSLEKQVTVKILSLPF